MRRAAAVLLATWTSIVVGACAKDAPPPPDDAPSGVAVKAVPIETRTFQDEVTAPGQWRSAGNVDLTAPFAGAVDSLAARPGDRVKRGQVLATMISEESRAELRGAELLRGDDAQRALDLARRDLVRVPLHAPDGGTLGEVAVWAGGEVAAGDRILTIIPAGARVFEAHVAAVDAGRVAPGQGGRILEPGGVSRDAVVDRVLPVADAADQSLLVWLRDAPEGPPPALGRSGTAKLEIGAPRQAAAVPMAAVVEDDLTGRTRIAVVAPGDVAAWTPVTLGGEDAGWREVVAPALAPGTRVIVAGHRGLPDSSRVRVTP